MREQLADELVGFLLARIAEDEEFAASVVPVVFRRRWVTAEAGVVLESPPPVRDLRTRVLADCEAKRRIVEDREHLAPGHGHGALLAHADFVLRALASTYAYHPDYREEWRP